MNRPRCVSLPLAVLSLSLVLTPRARAADPSPPSPLDERISIELVDANPAEALKSFSQLTGWRFDVLPGLQKKFTATLRNVRVRTALDVLCESVGCAWREVAGSPPSVRVTPVGEVSAATAPASLPIDQALGQAITLRLKDAATRDVLASFQAMLGSGLDIAEGVGGVITVDLEAVPVRAALDAVCAQAHCAWTVDTAGPKAVLRVRNAA